MQLKQLIDDDQAVSPVIGVILMVAITVILAAVIGTFVLGLGDQVQDSPPNANFQFEYTATGSDGFGDTNTEGDEVKITHTGGSDVDSENVQVLVAGTEVGSSSVWTSSTISTGTSFTYSEGGSTALESSDTVRIVWESSSGGSSQTIGESEVPS